MPSAIAYNTGSRTGQLIVSGGLRYADIEYAISSSINRDSFGINWYSPINPANGQLVLISNTFTQSIGNGGLNSNPVFYITGTSEEDLIGTSTSNPSYTGSLNRLSDTQNQRFTTTASALQYLAESGKYMLVNFTYPNIITDGLTAVYDASFYSSYPTTGSNWYDINGGNQIPPRSGSLFNTPTYVRTGDSGNLAFNPNLNQYAQLTGSYINRLNGTIIAWFTVGGNPGAQVRGIITNSGSANAGVNVFGWGFSSQALGEDAFIVLRATAGTGSSGPNFLIGSGSGIISGSAGISATTSNNTTFRFAAITWDLTTSTGAYAEPNVNNGGSPWFMPNVKPTDNTQVAPSIWVGSGGAGTQAGYANTNIGAIYFYNRKMTTAEISASYAITRTKYGGT